MVIINGKNIVLIQFLNCNNPNLTPYCCNIQIWKSLKEMNKLILFFYYLFYLLFRFFCLFFQQTQRTELNRGEEKGGENAGKMSREEREKREGERDRRGELVARGGTEAAEDMPSSPPPYLSSSHVCIARALPYSSSSPEIRRRGPLLRPPLRPELTSRPPLPVPPLLD